MQQIELPKYIRDALYDDLGLKSPVTPRYLDTNEIKIVYEVKKKYNLLWIQGENETVLVGGAQDLHFITTPDLPKFTNQIYTMLFGSFAIAFTAAGRAAMANKLCYVQFSIMDILTSTLHEVGYAAWWIEANPGNPLYLVWTSTLDRMPSDASDEINIAPYVNTLQFTNGFKLNSQRLYVTVIFPIAVPANTKINMISSVEFEANKKWEQPPLGV